MNKKKRDKQYTNSNFHTLEALNDKQKIYFDAMRRYDIVISTGPSGTGKTICAANHVASVLYNDPTKKLIITRPIVDACNESLGYLKGDLSDKMSAYLIPIASNLNDFLGKSHVEGLIHSGRIEGVPLGHMRGRSFNNCIILADEMQNSTPEQMKLLLTRMGKNSQTFINGDIAQVDIAGTNGLKVAVDYLSWMSEAVKVVEFEKKDIVRNALISDIIESFEKYEDS